MISGLGCAALLISKNLHSYHDHMFKMRDLLESLLEVTYTGMSEFKIKKYDQLFFIGRVWRRRYI